MTTPRAPKGTYDLLPDAAAARDAVVGVAARVFAAFGYRRVVTPEFEETGLFARGVGEATDIVRKEMYTFEDKGGRSLTLRPEGTAPICRAYLEHGLHKWPQPVKLWYYCPMFRYERPQAGRYREHYQLGAEAIGSAEPMVDAEVIVLLAQLFAELGVGGLRLAVNSMGDPACRPAYVARLREHLRGREDELCGDCRERLELNPLRTFDCKVESCRAVLDDAPHLVDHLCGDCREHFDAGARAAAPRRPRARARPAPGARPRLLHAHDLRVQLRPPRRPERRGGRGALRRARRAARRPADAGGRLGRRPRAHRPRHRRDRCGDTGAPGLRREFRRRGARRRLRADTAPACRRRARRARPGRAQPQGPAQAGRPQRRHVGRAPRPRRSRRRRRAPEAARRRRRGGPRPRDAPSRVSSRVPGTAR